MGPNALDATKSWRPPLQPHVRTSPRAWTARRHWWSRAGEGSVRSEVTQTGRARGAEMRGNREYRMRRSRRMDALSLRADYVRLNDLQHR